MGTRYKLRMLPIQRYNGQHRYVVQNASITLKYGTRYSASLIFTNMAFSVNQISETDTQILTKQPHNNALHANPISLNWSATGLSEGGLNSITFGFSLRKELTDLLIEEAKNPLHLFVAFHEKGNDTPVFTAAIPMTFEE
jgi:hypothetical protein